MIALPANTSRVILNIGSHVTPIRPPDDGSTIVIAFEPVVGCRIKPRPRLYVVHAAVAADTSLSTMGVYHANQGSSSLSPAYGSMDFAHQVQPSIIVPVLPMRTVIASIPVESEIWLLKTDMQGWDYAALVGAGELLRRVHYIRSECWLANTRPYNGPENDFCLHVLPYLTSQGFELVHMHGNSKARAFVNNWKGVTGMRDALAFCETTKDRPARAGLLEADAYFKRSGARLPPPTGSDWPFPASGPPIQS